MNSLKMGIYVSQSGEHMYLAESRLEPQYHQYKYSICLGEDCFLYYKSKHVMITLLSNLVFVGEL